MASLQEARRHYAEEIRLAGGVLSDALVDAFAAVPRERFLGPGPWEIPRPPRHLGEAWEYRPTADADPRHLCHNVLVAIDRERELHNGLPSFLAFKIAAASIKPDDRVVHIGCGVGYYTAIMAELAYAGRVVAVEVDAELARRSRSNLREWPNVEVRAEDGTQCDPGEADVFFINAGVTHPAPLWLERLADRGRMILPLTHRGASPRGIVLRVERSRELTARVISGVSVYDCIGGRDDRWNASLGEAFQRGDVERIRAIRPADHAAGEGCWVHVGGVCVSTRSAVDDGAAKPS